MGGTPRGGSSMKSPDESTGLEGGTFQGQLHPPSFDGTMDLETVLLDSYRHYREMEFLEASGKLSAPAKGAEGPTGMEAVASAPGSEAAKEGQQVMDLGHAGLVALGDAAEYLGINKYYSDPGIIESLMFGGNGPDVVKGMDLALKTIWLIPHLAGRAATKGLPFEKIADDFKAESKKQLEGAQGKMGSTSERVREQGLWDQTFAKALQPDSGYGIVELIGSLIGPGVLHRLLRGAKQTMTPAQVSAGVTQQAGGPAREAEVLEALKRREPGGIRPGTTPDDLITRVEREMPNATAAQKEARINELMQIPPGPRLTAREFKRKSPDEQADLMYKHSEWKYGPLIDTPEQWRAHMEVLRREAPETYQILVDDILSDLPSASKTLKAAAEKASGQIYKTRDEIRETIEKFEKKHQIGPDFRKWMEKHSREGVGFAGVYNAVEKAYYRLKKISESENKDKNGRPASPSWT